MSVAARQLGTLPKSAASRTRSRPPGSGGILSNPRCRGKTPPSAGMLNHSIARASNGFSRKSKSAVRAEFRDACPLLRRLEVTVEYRLRCRSPVSSARYLTHTQRYGPQARLRPRCAQPSTDAIPRTDVQQNTDCRKWANRVLPAPLPVIWVTGAGFSIDPCSCPATRAVFLFSCKRQLLLQVCSILRSSETMFLILHAQPLNSFERCETGLLVTLHAPHITSIWNQSGSCDLGRNRFPTRGAVERATCRKMTSAAPALYHDQLNNGATVRPLKVVSKRGSRSMACVYTFPTAQAPRRLMPLFPRHRLSR